MIPNKSFGSSKYVQFTKEEHNIATRDICLTQGYRRWAKQLTVISPNSDCKQSVVSLHLLSPTNCIWSKGRYSEKQIVEEKRIDVADDHRYLPSGGSLFESDTEPKVIRDK